MGRLGPKQDRDRAVRRALDLAKSGRVVGRRRDACYEKQACEQIINATKSPRH